jgi:hypothetical protein
VDDYVDGNDEMRRLTRPGDDEGLVMVITALALVGMCIVVALVVDIGAKASAHRAAQNSADAAALAVATDCAKGLACAGTPIGSYLVAGSTASTPLVDMGAKTVTVHAQKTAPYTFANVIGISSGTGHGTAVAKWGAIGAANTIPLTIANCEFSMALLNGTTDVVLYMNDPSPHSGCGGSPPGGFGWLSQSGCSVASTANGSYLGSNGVSSHGGEGCVIPLLGKEVLVPIFGGFVGNGSQATYTMVGYAAFKLTGYSFNGTDYGGTLGKKCPLDKTRGNYCIEGDFVRFSTQQGTIGSGTDFGAYTVNLIG